MDEDDDLLIEMQTVCNSMIHETIYHIQSKISDTLDPQQTANCIISALASNLGLILARIPDNYRMEYDKIITHIIHRSMMLTLEYSEENTYGQLGHA
jgi:predicted ATP-dependent Lon-type protease